MARDSIAVLMFSHTVDDLAYARKTIASCNEIKIYSITDLPAETTADIILLQWSLLPRLSELLAETKPEFDFPIIVYGPDEAVKAAFINSHEFIRYPFGAHELAARIHKRAPTVITGRGNLRLSLYGHELRSQKNSIILSDKERELLLVLEAFQPETVSRDYLYSHLFPNVPTNSRYPDIVASSLRKKIRFIASSEFQPILSVRGAGYRL